MFDQYGRVTGYGQMAPGRAVEKYEEPGQPGRPRKNNVVNNAIMGGMPVGNQPFAGAQHTTTPPQGQQPQPQPKPNIAQGIGGLDLSGNIGFGGGIAARNGGVLSPSGLSGQPTGNTPQEHRAIGTAAGHDMSWMNQPGAMRTMEIQDSNRDGIDDRDQPTPGGIPTTKPGAAPAAPATLADFQAKGFAGRGWNAEKWANTEHQTPKYLVGRALAGQMDQIRALPPEQRQGYVEQQLKSLVPAIEQQGWKVHEVKGEKVRISGGPDNSPPHWADAVTGVDGDAPRIGWHTDLGGQQPQGGPTMSFLNQAILGQALGEQGAPPEDYATRLRRQVMEALQGQPQLAQLI